jgi:hypothetical protein
VLLGELNRVANMVAMAVSAEHEIYLLEALLFFWTSRIVHDPRIDQDRLTGRSFNMERRMTEPREFVAFEIDQEVSLESCGQPLTATGLRVNKKFDVGMKLSLQFQHFARSRQPVASTLFTVTSKLTSRRSVNKHS